jgi:hypothetical protein
MLRVPLVASLVELAQVDHFRGGVHLGVGGPGRSFQA